MVCYSRWAAPTLGLPLDRGLVLVAASLEAARPKSLGDGRSRRGRRLVRSTRSTRVGLSSRGGRSRRLDTRHKCGTDPAVDRGGSVQMREVGVDQAHLQGAVARHFGQSEVTGDADVLGVVDDGGGCGEEPGCQPVGVAV